jgi:hypothetical protein
VAPLYAGLVAVMNGNLGVSAGFINQTPYSMAASAFNDVFGPPGQANNSFNGTTGYPASGDGVRLRPLRSARCDFVRRPHHRPPWHRSFRPTLSSARGPRR